VKIGLQIGRFGWPGWPANGGTKLAEIAAAADEAGLASLWVMDHFFQIKYIGPPEDPMLEAYTTLSYLAGATKRVRLGTMVTGVIYRHPGYLIKAVSTLDVLSGGRATLGIGAAWNEQEAVGLGFPFPPIKERFVQLEETLQIAKRMWSGDVTLFKGKHFSLARPINSPQPLTRPHPPILIGGMGEKKTLRLVAKYGDACNLFAAAGAEVIKRKLDVLKRHCDAIGRPYNEIERTVLATANLAPGAMTATDVINTCRALSNIGIQHVIFNMPNDHEITPLKTFGREVIPAAAEF
jgi:F420-dependent oxidoreductase-like protein